MTNRKVIPGQPVRGSQSGRPINAVLDLLGRRQTLRILWELRDEALTFRALQARCDNASPALLNKRLAELRAARIVEHHGGEGYRLSSDGRRLRESLGPLYRWALDWARLFEVEDGNTC